MESSFDASELAGCLSDLAKTNADFWTRCSNLPVRPRQMITPAGVTSPVARTSNLPLLPNPKPLQAEKRPRDTEVMAHEGQRAVVLSLPHDTLCEDLTRLFDPYSVYVHRLIVSSRYLAKIGSEYINLLSHSPGNAVVGLTSAEEASRAVRELSGKLLQGSSISLLTERITGVSFIGAQLALSKRQMALDENRPSKRIRSDQEEAPIAGQHAEQTIHRAESQAKKKAKTLKDIQYLIGGLSPDAKAYQVKAFLDTHHMYKHA